MSAGHPRFVFGDISAALVIKDATRSQLIKFNFPKRKHWNRLQNQKRMFG